MTRGPTYYCWHCYQPNDHPQGACAVCGQPVEAPATADHVDNQLWALCHPIVERRMVAVRSLGLEREERAVAPLRRMVETRGSAPAPATARAVQRAQHDRERHHAEQAQHREAEPCPCGEDRHVRE